MIKSSREIILDSLKRARPAAQKGKWHDSTSRELSWIPADKSWDTVAEKLRTLSADICISDSSEKIEEFVSLIIRVQNIKTAICWQNVLDEMPVIKNVLVRN